jgi:Sulfotransferase family
MPRSGTTLVTETLAAHPAVWASPETHFFPRGARAVTEARRSGASAVVRNAIVTWAARPPCSLDQAEVAAAVVGLDDETLLRAAPVHVLFALLDQLGGATAEVVLEKTPRHLESLGGLLHDDPDLVGIIVVRDPRDVWRSLEQVGWAGDTTPSQIGRRWSVYGREALRLVGEHGDRVRIVPFESWTTDHDRQARSVLAWLGLDPDAPRARSGPTTFSPDHEPWKVRASERPDPARVLSWQGDEVLPGEQQLEAAVAHLLRPFGYRPPRTSTPMPLAAAAHLREWVAWTRYRTRVRTGRMSPSG